MIKFLSRLLLILIVGLCSYVTVYAQVADTTRKATAKDSNSISFMVKMQAFAKKSARESAEDFSADKAALAQNNIFEQIKKTMQKAKSYLRTGVELLEPGPNLSLPKKIF